MTTIARSDALRLSASITPTISQPISTMKPPISPKLLINWK